jgi:hypothetical protein
MPTVCVPLARGRRARLTLLDACSEPVEGAASTLVSNGLISVAHAPNYQDPEEIAVSNANGDLCIDDPGDANLRWIDLTIIMCEVNPSLFGMITGNPLVLDDAVAPNTTGFRINKGTDGTGNFALELWSGVTGQACNAAGEAQYGYFLLPWVAKARVGEWTWGNVGLNMTLTARALFGSTWGVGPYNVREDAVAGTPEPLLTAIDDEDFMHFETVTLAPPEAACSPSALVIP